jgi:hypothetical protein
MQLMATWCYLPVPAFRRCSTGLLLGPTTARLQCRRCQAWMRINDTRAGQVSLKPMLGGSHPNEHLMWGFLAVLDFDLAMYRGPTFFRFIRSSQLPR